MASIVTSVIVSNVAQVDGRDAVVEQHTDSLGDIHPYLYLADAGTDFNAMLAAHATQVLNSLASSEITANLLSIDTSGASAVISTNYNTLSQVINSVLAIYATLVGQPCMNSSAWLNTLTYAQLAAANPGKFPNVTAFTNWRAQFVTPGVNSLNTANALVGG
jgi:hypothetical protein